MNHSAPQTREDAVAYLRQRGFKASIRGASGPVQVFGEPLPEIRGVRPFKGLVWIVEGSIGWEVEDIRFLVPVIDRYATLREACEGAIRILGPLWDQRETTYLALKVERIEELRGRVYVFARLESQNSMADVTAGVMLNGCAIDPWVQVERALDGIGNPAPGLFAFRLQQNTDRRHFELGQYVSLIAIDEST